jgi:hypothetical protein
MKRRWLAVILVAASLAIPVLADPGSARAQDEAVSEDMASPNTPHWGIGARLRYVFLPTAVINLFVDHSTPLSAMSFALEAVRRKGDLDVVISLDYTQGSPPDGLYLEQGDDPNQPGQAPDWTEFDGVGLLSLDVSFIWHANLHRMVQFRYGAGVGIGLVTGTIYQTDTVCPPGTTASDLDDENHCARVTGTRAENESVPPVLPVVNVLLGFRFLLADQISINVEGGFRDCFFFGAGANYVF